MPGPHQPQAGLTIVELLVAMALGLMLVLAAVAALVLSRQGFSQIDAASQLRENARFAELLIQRLALQAGYRDIAYAATARPPSTHGMSLEKPNIFGFDNRTHTTDTSSTANSTPRTLGSPGYGSDVLVLRFQAAASGSSTIADQAIIDCQGLSPSRAMNDRYERYSSVFHIATSQGEPTLMCTRWEKAEDSGSQSTEPLVSGVELFQVLYGIDTTGKTVTLEDGSTENQPDSVVDQYLTATQMHDPDPDITLQRWQQVRSLRIGMVLRGATGTAIANTSTTTLYPLGSSPTSQSLFADNSIDPGSSFSPPNDGRLRQVVTFTVHLRNPQGDSQ